MNSDRVVSALGLYDPPTDPVAVPVGQSLIAWPRLEPFVPGEHLQSGNLRLRAHDTPRSQWLTIDTTLPPIIADFVKALPTSTAAWYTASTENMLLPEATADREVLFYHADHLGSAHVMTGLNGITVQESYNYPFGAIRHSHEPIELLDQLYGFTQKEKDAESDLHYFEARYLGSSLSRFLSADPKFSNPGLLSPEGLGAFLGVPQKSNLYSYVLNNPVNLDDPTGLDEDDGTPSPGDQMVYGTKKIVNSFKDGVVQGFKKTVLPVMESDAPDGVKVAYAIVSPIPWAAGTFAYTIANQGEGVLHIVTGAGRAYVNAVKSSVPIPSAPLVQEPAQTEDLTTLKVNDFLVAKEPPPPPPGPEEIRVPQRRTPPAPRSTPQRPPIKEGSPCVYRSVPGGPLYGK